jgi:hypothetical protein
MQDNQWYIESNASLGELAYEGEAVLTVSLEWEAVDNGIGDYEYWGSKESQHDWQMELQEIHIEEAFLYDDDGNQIPVDLKDPSNKPLVEFWTQYIADCAEYD